MVALGNNTRRVMGPGIISMPDRNGAREPYYSTVQFAEKLLRLPSAVVEPQAPQVTPTPDSINQRFAKLGALGLGTRAPCDEEIILGESFTTQLVKYPKSLCKLHALLALGYAHREEFSKSDHHRSVCEIIASRVEDRDFKLFQLVTYHQISRAKSQYFERRGDAALFHEEAATLSDLRDKIVSLRRSGREVPSFQNAWYVGEGEIGWTKDEAMGTGNVCQCVTAALMHEATGIKVLLHLQRVSQLPDLLNAVRMLRAEAPGSNVSALIAGALLGNLQQCNMQAELNGFGVAHRLCEENVRIAGIRLFDDEQPRSLVLPADEFAFYEGDALRSLRPRLLLDAVAKAAAQPKLREGPDTRRGYGGSPVYVAPELMALADYEGPRWALAEMWYRQQVDGQSLSGCLERIAAVEFMLAINEAVHSRLHDLSAIAGQSKDQLHDLHKKTGIYIPQ